MKTQTANALPRGFGVRQCSGAFAAAVHDAKAAEGCRSPRRWRAVAVAFLFCVSSALAAENWVSLFNGTNLDGWVKMNDGIFVATNGVLHIEGGKGWLRTEQEFGDFTLEAEWRGLETNYNSGFFVRAPIEGKPWATNIWQINTKQSAIGELLQGSAKIVKSATPPVAAGEWVKFHAEARGTNLTLDVDGKRAWEFHALEPARGYVGIQAEGRAAEFRNVQVRGIGAGEK